MRKIKIWKLKDNEKRELFEDWGRKFPVQVESGKTKKKTS